MYMGGEGRAMRRRHSELCLALVSNLPQLPALKTSGVSSVVERLLYTQRVGSSNLSRRTPLCKRHHLPSSAVLLFVTESLFVESCLRETQRSGRSERPPSSEKIENIAKKEPGRSISASEKIIKQPAGSSWAVFDSSLARFSKHAN